MEGFSLFKPGTKIDARFNTIRLARVSALEIKTHTNILLSIRQAPLYTITWSMIHTVLCTFPTVLESKFLLYAR